MNTIDYRVMREAGEHVQRCAERAEIHTVTVTLNGAHGGADVRIEGIRTGTDIPLTIDDLVVWEHEVQ